jgi:hypothetical protein
MKKTISYLFASVAIVSLVALGSCSDDDEKLPPIDGYNNSDEVSSENLVAHWTFDGTNNEAISSTAPASFGTVGFEAGQIGQALKLDSGALVFPTIASINEANALNNFSVSLWVKVKGTKRATNYFSTFFSLAPTTVSEIWPDIFLGAETSRHLPTSDTLELKGIINTHPVGLPKDQQDNIAQPNPNVGTPDSGTGAWFINEEDWAHFVLSWNATTHKLSIYGNGVSVGGYSTRPDTGVEILAVPVKAIFGSFPSSDLGFASAPETQGWGPLLTGSIDDVRIFNTALDGAEVTALFNLGSAGR